MTGVVLALLLYIPVGGQDTQDWQRLALQAVEERDTEGFEQAARQIRTVEGDPPWLRIAEGDLHWWTGRHHDAMDAWEAAAATAGPRLAAGLEERARMAAERRAYEQRLHTARRRARAGSACAGAVLVLPWLALTRRRHRS